MKTYKLFIRKYDIMLNDYIVEETFPLNTNSVSNLTNKINYIKNTYLNNNSNIYYGFQ